MTQTYRTDDLARWGTGQGFNLSPAQVDNNFWDIIQRLIVQEALVIPAGISYFSITGTMMYVHMDDGTVLGPYELPVATFVDRGVWAPDTVYSVMDTFSINGGLYVVVFAHRSEATFDPGANDGAGHDYYQLMIQTPGSTLPPGGLNTQVLMKSSDTIDYAVTWGYHLPIGGTTGQTIIKQSATQDHATWGAIDASDVGFVPAAGSSLTSDNVADALEEVSGGDAIDIAYTPPAGSSLTADNVQDAIDELESSAGGGIGKHTIWVPATAMVPQTSNGPASGTVELTTNKVMVATLDYDKTTRENAQFSIAMPKSWDRDDITFRAYWSHTTGATAFGVAIGLQTLPIGNLTGIDNAWATGTVVTDSEISANALFLSDISGAVSLGADEGDLVWFRLYRDPANASDTLDADCRIHGVQIFYNTTAGSDD